jgi:chromosome segregation ATPase
MSTEQLQAIFPTLLGMAVAIGGWWYSLRNGLRQAEERAEKRLAAAQERLEQSYKDHVSDLEGRLRLLETTRDDCKDRLTHAEAELERIGLAFSRMWGGPT